MLEHQSPPGDFTPGEWAALIALRDRYRQDPGAPRASRSFEEQYGLEFSLHPADTATPPRYWTCFVQRQAEDGAFYRTTTTFCVRAEEPTPPTLREVMHWLAIGVAHRLTVRDRRGWAAMYHLHHSGLTPEPAYRGIVRPASSYTAFEAALEAEHRALLVLLGKTGFTELMSLVGLDDRCV